MYISVLSRVTCNGRCLSIIYGSERQIWKTFITMFTTDISAREQRKKMESEKEKCGNCGKTFYLKGKSYDRKSFNANLKLKTIYKTTKVVLEEEFDVKLTPGEKRKRFLCNSCSRSLLSIAKSTHSRK
jgi:hypothetical protein